MLTNYAERTHLVQRFLRVLITALTVQRGCLCRVLTCSPQVHLLHQAGILSLSHQAANTQHAPSKRGEVPNY